ncbi:MAG: ribosome small subunit-dependent GTPase A, partial [Clostridia bacterium]|nr:ribosome small subunit-dependent GTPase A [Clostridia bacterium]
EQYRTHGKILRGLGGLYDIRLCSPDHHKAVYEEQGELSATSPLAGHTISCRARGLFRYHKEKPLIGDEVCVNYSDASFSANGEEIIPDPNGTDVVVAAILPRRSALIRPPMANLDMLFVTMACASPDPIPQMADKLLCIAEYHHITPVVLLTKSELNRDRAEKLRAIYQKSGFPVFLLGQRGEEGADEVQTYLREHLLPGQTAAFAGASGVGKSTLLNALFPDLQLETSAVSEKTERGRHTTRCVTLYPVNDQADCPYLADTPGFSALDFEQFDFFGKEDLPHTVREFAPYLGQCRYTNCSHTKESASDCAIVRAVEAGEIPKSRHESYCALYDVLKNKNSWDKK